jgi:DNA-binding helix-hairpin-helix protein with protein kinase domain
MSTAVTREERAFTAQGEVIELHSKIGEGGEGAVFHIGGKSELIAKIYKPFESQEERDERHAKVSAIVRHDNDRVRSAAAWPQQILFDESGQFSGFVMEYLSGYMPLYMAYQIKSRVRRMPGRNFRYLVRLARNLATCVHFVHEASLVIGDLNESNVLATPGAMVRLIDVDSFQIEVDGKILTPKVGKLELLPPELHGVDLENRVRTREEDAFSLAVLIFQTLVFGRHPFAGRPTDDSMEITLEDAISCGWYVYSSRRSTPLSPPPYLTIDWLPEEIRKMFEEAFEPNGNRPTPMEWHEALKRLEENLQECSASELHDFPANAVECPWCRLERAWNVSLFGGEPPKPDEGHAVNIDEIWERIEALRPAGVFEEMPAPANYLPQQPAAPTAVSWISKFQHLSVMGLAISIKAIHEVAIGQWPSWVFLLILPVIILFGLLPMVNWSRRLGVRLQMRELDRKYNQVADQWRLSGDVELFYEQQRLARSIIQEYRDLTAYRHNLSVAYLRTMYGRHVHAYLSRYSLAIADVPSGERSQLENLMDRGIKTAADVSRPVLLSMLPKGSKLADDLVEWANMLEDQFWLNSNFQLDITRQREIDAKVESRRKELLDQILHAEEELQKAAKQLADNQRAILREYESFAPELAMRLAQMRQLGEKTDERPVLHTST